MKGARVGSDHFKRFAAEEVIIHEVPQRFVGDPNRKLDLSQKAEKLTGQLRPFFDRKLKGSLARYGFDVAHDASQSTPIPGLVAEIAVDKTKLVAASQKMAEHLYGVQTGVNPAGLLCVAIGDCGGQTGVAVLKVERDEGARVQRQGSGAQRSLTMAYLDDLMITGKTRIFKASLFVLGGSTAKSLSGRVADDQRGNEYGHDVASFFLSLFLGCKLRIEPRVATREVFTVAEQFINEEVDTPERKANYTLSLLAEMHAPSRDIRPRDFATQFFEPEDRTPFRQFLAEHEIDADAVIQKDISLIENRISRVRMETEEGLMLLGRGELINRLIDVEDERVVIRDRVVKTRGS